MPKNSSNVSNKNKQRMLFWNKFTRKWILKSVIYLVYYKSVIYLRYIDDIFMVWIKSKSELRHFMNEINQKHQSIKFDFKFSKESIEFLDTLVFMDARTDSRSPSTKNQLTVKTIYMRNRHTRSHLKKVFRIVRHSELSAYVQPSRNTENIPKT